MKLIVGLGNPELKYQHTRHNVGFILLDTIAETLEASWRTKPKFKALIAETQIGGEKAWLVKPTTYYNLSGESAQAIVDFYKLAAATDILVIHDELALPFGTIRTRLSGSDAGNNGIRSLIAHLGEDFARIRVGIANEQSARTAAVDFVLSSFSAPELATLKQLASSHVYPFVEDFVHQEREFAPTSITIDEA